MYIVVNRWGQRFLEGFPHCPGHSPYIQYSMTSFRKCYAAVGVSARVEIRTLSQLLRGAVETSCTWSQEALGNSHNFSSGHSPHWFRCYHSSPLRLGSQRKQLATLEGAHEFLSSLSPAQRSNLNSALQRIHILDDEKGVSKTSLTSTSLLTEVCQQ